MNRKEHRKNPTVDSRILFAAGKCEIEQRSWKQNYILPDSSFQGISRLKCYHVHQGHTKVTIKSRTLPIKNWNIRYYMTRYVAYIELYGYHSWNSLEILKFLRRVALSGRESIAEIVLNPAHVLVACRHWVFCILHASLGPSSACFEALSVSAESLSQSPPHSLNQMVGLRWGRLVQLHTAFCKMISSWASCLLYIICFFHNTPFL